MTPIGQQTLPQDATEASVSVAKSSEMSRQSWMGGNTLSHAGQANANQLASLNAMIAYLAHASGQSEFRIERSLADRFDVPNVGYLVGDQFDNAIRFLVDTIKV
jgi:hypothetical protein